MVFSAKSGNMRVCFLALVLAATVCVFSPPGGNAAESPKLVTLPASLDVSPPSQNDRLEIIKKRGKLIVAQLAVQVPPFFWSEEENGQEVWIGYETDFAKSLAKKLGVEVEYYRIDSETYNDIPRAVQNGHADIGLSNLSITDTRKEWVDFSEPYIVGRVAMILNLDALDAALPPGEVVIGPEDLNRPEVIVGLTQGSIYSFAADILTPDATRAQVPQGGFDELVPPVLSGQVHLVIDDELAIMEGLFRNPELSKEVTIYPLDGPLYEDPRGICVPKNQPNLLRFVNEAIEEVERTEPLTVEYMLEKYLK